MWLDDLVFIFELQCQVKYLSDSDGVCMLSVSS